MFRDEATVEVIAGKGGDGIVSFRREKYVAHGGPDGGDGGKGGDVIFVATSDLRSLLELGRTHRYAAENGRPGGPRKRTGRGGADRIVEVPVGTLVYDADRGNLLRDLERPGQRLVVAAGGRPGKGNVHFANSVRQVPKQATRGLEGERRTLRLELKLFAEVGLLGFPNAGKSTFLSRVSAARPKIADYPFTTLDPEVGIATVGDLSVGDGATLVIADLPGLIEGAAEGVGLGHRFLRHVERCAVLLHLVDVSESAERDPVEAYEALESELERYSPDLAAKPRLVVASKCFEEDASEARRAALEEAVGAPVLGMSSVLGTGVQEVLSAALVAVRGAREGI